MYLQKTGITTLSAFDEKLIDKYNFESIPCN